MADINVRKAKEQLKKAYQLVNSQRLSEARAIYSEFNDVDTDDIELITSLGGLAFRLKEFVDAIYRYTRAAELQPDNANHKYSLAIAMESIGEQGEAREILLKTIELDPKMTPAYIRLGVISNNIRDFQKALDYLEKAIALKTSDPNAYFSMIVTLKNLGRHADSLDCAKKLLRLKKSAETYTSLSNVQMELGEIDEAVRSLQRAIELDDTYGNAYLNLAQITRYTDKDMRFILKTEKALNKDMTAVRRANIEFSLGKMYDDIRQWDKAFEHYRQGNLLAREAIDPTEGYGRDLKARKKRFAKKLFVQKDLFGSESEVPVFVVGMPRSGTTLIDQIITSHPEGGSVGESTEIRYFARSLFSKHGGDTSAREGGISKAVLEKYANKYLEEAQTVNKGASRIVDKMPDNSDFVGLIHLLFRNARIIHSVRNPLDVCLSCYFQYILDMPYAFDLGWLAKRYRYYRRTMDYWKRVLPPGRIFDFSYDEVVADPESRIPPLIEHVGLEWNDACMTFYETKRAISTASLWQVRQPLYRSSSRRWINYATHISELANALAEFLDDQDIEELKTRGIKIRRKHRLF